MNMSLYWTSLLLVASTLLQTSHQKSTKQDNFYRAAVVEYNPIRESHQTIQDILNSNGDEYVAFIEEAAKHDADIIVFPERGLTTTGISSIRRWIYLWTTQIPDPQDNIVLCGDDTLDVFQVLRTISCAARDNQIYVVINLSEKVYCDPENENCSPDGWLFYNTNVVFDRSGAVISKYRKYNLFVEYGFNATSTAEYSIFETDFGVTFGQFICFDVLFPDPALTLVHTLNITDFVFTVAWFSELPYLTGVQVQEGWAKSVNANVLGSGYNNPWLGSGGSGIFNGNRGGLVSTLPYVKSNKLLVATVPKFGYPCDVEPNPVIIERPRDETPVGSIVESLNIFTDNLTSHTTHLIDEGVAEHNLTLCNRGLCCHFEAIINVTQTIEVDDFAYTFRFDVFNGTRTFSLIRTGGAEVCGVLACKDKSLDSCMTVFPWGAVVNRRITFESLKISGTFQHEDSLQFPTTVRDDMLPLPANGYEYIPSSTRSGNRVEMRLLSRQDNLLGFGIYGRVFSRDGAPSTSA